MCQVFEPVMHFTCCSFSSSTAVLVSYPAAYCLAEKRAHPTQGFLTHRVKPHPAGLPAAGAAAAVVG
jgi:hypothetical protein